MSQSQQSRTGAAAPPCVVLCSLHRADRVQLKGERRDDELDAYRASDYAPATTKWVDRSHGPLERARQAVGIVTWVPHQLLDQRPQALDRRWRERAAHEAARRLAGRTRADRPAPQSSTVNIQLHEHALLDLEGAAPRMNPRRGRSLYTRGVVRGTSVMLRAV